MRIEEWNERYRFEERLNNEPAPVLVHAVQTLQPGRALDLACGAGRNAVWLARQGWSVTAIDGAPEAIRHVETQAEQEGLAIDARVLDLETEAPLPFEDDSADVVAILYYLHQPLFTEARRVLRPGGLIITAVRTSGIHARFCLSIEELRAEFQDWDVLLAHSGPVAELVARKPAYFIHSKTL